jgi:hypothetical protein
VPPELKNAVAIAAKRNCTAALSGDGHVFVWGETNYGQTAVPPGLANVVSISVGDYHMLALRSDGTVIGWGGDHVSDFGEANVPLGLSNVVAISAGTFDSVALRRDGTALCWGSQFYGNTVGLSNIVSVTFAGGIGPICLVAETGILPTEADLEFLRAGIGSRIFSNLADCDQQVLTELSLPGVLQDAGTQLSASKLLITSILELGLPFTLQADDVLHGMLYGSQALADTNAVIDLLSEDIASLKYLPNPVPLILGDVLNGRTDAFTARLNARLAELQTSPQPEVPRMIGHTLRLLDLLREARVGGAPPPVMDIVRSANPTVTIYGEPHVRYALHESITLTNWTNIGSVTNEQSFRIGSQATPHFYKASFSP